MMANSIDSNMEVSSIGDPSIGKVNHGARFSIKAGVALIFGFTFLVGLIHAFRSPPGNFVGMNFIESHQLGEVDRAVERYKGNFEYINLALVSEDRIVLTKSYGFNRLERREVYASVSKPVTATILMQLYEKGRIASLGESIEQYDPEYAGAIPNQYAGSTITFEQLLTHQSGISHLSKLWSRGKLILDFQPGTNVSYSTNGFGILGAVMSEITGDSYARLVKEYIGRPVDAASFTAMPWFQAPGGQVRSTIEDMARFAIGMMDGTYLPPRTLEELVYKVYAVEAHGALCLGWYCRGAGSENFVIYHAGSNGMPRAFLMIEPYQGIAVALAGRATSASNPQTLGDLAIDLVNILRAK